MKAPSNPSGSPKSPPDKGGWGVAPMDDNRRRFHGENAGRYLRELRRSNVHLTATLPPHPTLSHQGRGKNNPAVRKRTLSVWSLPPHPSLSHQGRGKNNPLHGSSCASRVWWERAGAGRPNVQPVRGTQRQFLKAAQRHELSGRASRRFIRPSPGRLGTCLTAVRRWPQPSRHRPGGNHSTNLQLLLE